MKRKTLIGAVMGGVLICSAVIFFVLVNKPKELEVVNIATDKMFYSSLTEIENDSTIIIEGKAGEVLGQEVSTSYDYEFKKELPGSGYTQREIEITKTYKGDVQIGDKIILLHDYYEWTNEDESQQLISVSSLKPLEKGENYLMFLLYDPKKEGYFAVCDYQGVYPVENMTEAVKGQKLADFSYIYQTQDLQHLIPVYDEVLKKYFK